MKRFAVIAVLLLGLGGCSMETGQSVDSTALQAVITKIQSYTRQICSYIPSDGTVKQILAAVDPLAETAYNIAAQICRAVTASTETGASPAILGFGEKAESCPMVAGVCVEGQFVPKDVPPPNESVDPPNQNGAPDPNAPKEEAP